MTYILGSKALPGPMVLIKDWKKANNTSDDPTMLVAPARNFTSYFPKLDNLGINKLFDRNQIEYTFVIIGQVSDLKK